MNRVICALCIIVLMVGFVGFHTYNILNLNRDIAEICDRVEKKFDENDWAGIQKELMNLQGRWDKSRFWASLTIDTAEIEEIEISLCQSMAYAEICAEADFIGEFIMFKMKLGHLPHQEGFSVEELL